MHRTNWLVALLIAPAVVLAILTVLLPLGMMGWLSLYESNFLTTRWVGFSNYVRMLSDLRIPAIGYNSVLYMLFIVPSINGLALAIALLIHSLPSGWQHPTRVIVYAPTLSAGIIISNSWKWIFHPRGGLVNWILSLAGITPVVWFSTRWTTIPTIAVIHSLTVCGSMAIIYCAALKSTGKDIIDAARIDGAGGARTIFSIYLPAIASTIALLVLISSMSTLQIMEWIYMLAQHDGAITLMYNIYHEGFLYSRYGYASAQSVVLVAVILLVARMQKRLQTWQTM